MEVNDPCEVLLVVVMLCCADAYSEQAWVLDLGWMYCIGGSQFPVGFFAEFEFSWIVFDRIPRIQRKILQYRLFLLIR